MARTSGYLDLGDVKSHHVLLFIIVMTLVVLFIMRKRIAEAHDRWRANRRVEGYNRVNGDSFVDDLESGLNSDTFSITSNISNNDPRGLAAAKEEIRKIMNEEHISFDEARLRYTRSELNRNNVDEDGLPRDPKLVTF